MKLAARKDALAVRELAATGVPFDYFLGENDDNVVCLMGIEHCLTDARLKQLRASRKRCARAVLQEQKRQRLMGLSSILSILLHLRGPSTVLATSTSPEYDTISQARQGGSIQKN